MLRKKISEDKSLSEIRDTKEVEEADLLQRPGVTGVDVGYKYVNGKKTDEIGIRVFVENKTDVQIDEMIPETIDSVKTDVIQQKFILHSLKVRVAKIKPQEDTGNYSPLKGGISIGPCRVIHGHIYAGTLGIIVKDNSTGNPMLLSNYHVMCIDDGWSVGDTIVQPSRIDGGNCPDDVVGTLSRASLGEQVDCAVALQTARDQVCEIVDIGAVNGTASTTLGMNVRKRGRTTGLTYGTVEGIDGSVPIDYGNGLGTVTLTNQINIKADPVRNTLFSDHGDSGSVVVNDSGAVIGLLFAGGGDITWANPIEAVLSAMDVSICSSGIESSRSLEERLTAIEALLSQLLASESKRRS
jgi:hypothetical protein